MIAVLVICCFYPENRTVLKLVDSYLGHWDHRLYVVGQP